MLLIGYIHHKNLIGRFTVGVDNGTYNPREYILENLSVEECSKKFMDIINKMKPNK